MGGGARRKETVPPFLGKLRLEIKVLWEIYLRDCEGGLGGMGFDHSPPPSPADGRARGRRGGDYASPCSHFPAAKPDRPPYFLGLAIKSWELRGDPPQEVRRITVPHARLWPGTLGILGGFSDPHCHRGVVGHRPSPRESVDSLVRERNFISEHSTRGGRARKIGLNSGGALNWKKASCPFSHQVV